MDIKLILTIVFAVLGVWLFIKIISAPIRVIMKFLLNAVLGFVMLFIVNLVGSMFSFSVPMNLITALISGIFGIPGILFIIVFQILF